MKNNKKTLVLAIASILSAGALLGVVTSTQTGGVANIFAADDESSYIWNHYKAVAPTIDSHGSKEFWANCSVPGQVRFEKPTKGKVQKENLDFKATPWFDELTPDDARYVAPLSSRTVATLSSKSVTLEENSGAEFKTFDGAFDQMAYDNGVVYGTKNKLIAEFGGSSRANDGIFIITKGKATTYTTASITLPTINFLEELKDGGVVSMELGGRTAQCSIKFKNTTLFTNNDAILSDLTKVRAYFYLDGTSVKVSFVVTYKDAKVTDYSKYSRIEISSELDNDEATGKKGLVFSLNTNSSNRHYWFSHPTLVSKKEFKTPARPTRPADDLYESYSFAGWYSETGKYDFSNPITAEERFTPKWVPGKQAPSYLDIGWAKADFGMGVTGSEGGTTSDIYDVAGALNGLTWGWSAADKKAYTGQFNKACSIQDVTDKTGIFMRANGKGSYIDLPKINFLEKIPFGKKLFMKLGTNNGDNILNITTSANETKRIIRTTGSETGHELLTKVLVSFYKGTDNKIHMTCNDTTVDLFIADGEQRIWETVLTDTQANGTESLRFVHGQNGPRYYWIGKPFVYNDDNVALNTITEGNVTVGNAVLKTRAQTISEQADKNYTPKTAPHGQWYNSPVISGESDGIGILGNDSKNAATLEFKANYKALLDKSQGVKFTIGVWNGTDTIYFNEGDGYASLGGSYVKPNISNKQQYFDTNKYTREIIEKTWHNWQATVDRFDGLTVYNQNTAEKYQFTLTEGQLNGTEPLSFKLTASNANGHFFYLSNLTTFYC